MTNGETSTVSCAVYEREASMSVCLSVCDCLAVIGHRNKPLIDTDELYCPIKSSSLRAALLRLDLLSDISRVRDGADVECAVEAVLLLLLVHEWALDRG